MDKEIPLSEKQGKHLESIFQAKAAVERDLQNAVSFACAGADLELEEGVKYRYEPDPPRVIVTLEQPE